MLALEPGFKAAHEAPAPLDYTPGSGKTFSFSVDSGERANAFFVPSPHPTRNVVFVFHEWWGLNDYIKREAEKIREELGDVEVYAIDLYDGKVATTPDEASALMSSLDKNRAGAIIKGLLEQMPADKHIVTIGWCMGGTWSLMGTLLSGKRAHGCVMYYGFPIEDEKLVKTINTDVLFIRGNLDTYITTESIDKLKEEVESTQHKFTLKGYNAVHAFANPSNPKYDKKAAGDAHKKAMKFIKEHFKQK